MESAASEWIDRLLQAPPPADVDERGLLDEVRARLFGVARARPRLGRYEITGVLGQGGSARVLRGRDPQLCRDVAIKVIHATSHGPPPARAEARLAHEARMLARLVHPNVVAVYDVGRVPGDTDGVYVVMELVEGCDLSVWLARPRSPAEILAVFRAAGRGLAAAHAIGLLHRDFKPHNVLVGGDGRVRVADFGLSLVRRAGEQIGSAPSLGPASSWTAPGCVVGTPMYMAPEQHRGEPLDDRCDQYAFCFALREALWGRPTLAQLADPHAFKSAPPRLSPRAGVAPRIVRAIERGLAPDPRARWPGMDALLVALSDDGRTRRMALATGGLAIAVATVAMMGGRSTQPGPCGGEDPGWTQVWNPEVRDTIGEAFAASAPALAADVSGPLDARMQSRARAWDDARGSACDVADAVALACLVEQRDRTAALVARWQDGGMGAVVGARTAVEALDDPASCLLHGERDPPSAGDGEAIAIDALLATGRIDEAAARARQARRRLDDGEAATAALAVAIGRALAEVGESEAAAQVLARGHEIAQRVDDRAGAIRTAGLLITIVGTRLGRDEEADAWVRHAEVALARAGDPIGRRAWVERHLGHLAGARGQWESAREHYAADAASLAETVGAGSLGHIQALDNVAAAALHLGHLPEALALARHVVAGKRRMLGDHHPDLALSLHNLAVAELEAGELGAARVDVDAALVIWRDLFGEHNPDVALARYTLGSILLAEGEAEAAEVELAASLATRRALLGAGQPDTLGTAIVLARARERLGRIDEAIALFEAVVRFQEDPGQTRGDREAVLRELGALRRRRAALVDARATRTPPVEAR